VNFALATHLPPREAPVRATEVLPTAALLLLGVGLDWVSSTYPGLLPEVIPWEFSWPQYLAMAFPLFWYWRGIARTPPSERPSWGRRALFMGGMLSLWAVLQTGFLYLAEHMFLLHRLQHLIMHHWGPFLIALSWPGESLFRGMPGWARSLVRSRPVQWSIDRVQQPVLAAVLFAGLVYLWLYPPLFFRAMINARLYGLMDWTMVVDGVLFFCLLFDPRPQGAYGLSFASRIVLALSVQIPQVAIGALLMFTTRDLYPWYTLCGRVFSAFGAQVDQEMGGIIIFFGGGMMSALAALILLGRLWEAEEEAVALAAADR
jgi:putative membrane protein